MENILDQIREGFQSMGHPYISQFQILLIVLIILTILFFILLGMLKNIDNHLVNIGETLSNNTEGTTKAADSETQVQNENVDPLREIAQEEIIPEGKFAMGRSGKVYTEAELELQIRE